MTEEQKEICLALGKPTYLPGSFDKRFAHNLSSLAQHQPEKELTENRMNGCSDCFTSIVSSCREPTINIKAILFAQDLKRRNRNHKHPLEYELP